MTRHFKVYLVIGALETVVENIQNVGELSLKCANAFQILRYLQLNAKEETLTISRTSRTPTSSAAQF